MVVYRFTHVDQREAMPSTPSSILDDRYSKGILLIVVLFFSWLLSVKNLVLDWTGTSEESQSSAIPNILMIVVDDLGYNDTSAINSSGLSTPNLEELAQQGVTFRRHYADSTCTPSRVALLTGRYPERSGFRPVGSEIPAEFSTIAEELRDAGYETYLTGKWHAGEERPHAWPQNKGFDHWFGFLNQWELAGEVKESDKGRRKPTYRDPMLRENGGVLKRYSGHLTDILTDHTIQNLERLQSADKPWFLYHAFLAPHQPIQPAERYAKDFPDTPEGKYTALVAQLDDAIGRILDAVDRENTLVIFVSDNGGTNSERNNNFPFFGKKSEMLEGAFRTPLIVSWPGFIPEGKTIDEVVMNVDIYPTLLAASHREAPQGLDGKNLWPVFLHDGVIDMRSRSWEVYSANVNTLSFSYLSESDNWRLSNQEGLSPSLFNLLDSPSGESDVASNHADSVAELTGEFWREFWRKSLIAVNEQQVDDESQTLYSGFDAMRTPYRHGFSIGLEIGPLPKALIQETGRPVHILAGQGNVWELQFKAGLGLEWHMGNVILRDPHFEPSQCNAIILTGYFEPKGHLAKREPESTLKLYSSGFLRDAHSDAPFNPADDNALQSPTFVNFHGKATFSNIMLSSFADSYSPRLLPQFMEYYTSAYREQRLSLPDVKMMDAELCN
jgi:arylsulfatase A-like enzyme